MSLDLLRRRHPWPAPDPAVEPEDHGWFHPDSARMLAARVGPRTGLILELGSWLGQSTRWLLERAPAATVIAVDTWEGGPDHRANAAADPTIARLLPELRAKFTANLLGYKARLIPVRATTVEGMAQVAAFGLTPELVFVDADHSQDAVFADVFLALRLFPTARLVGDDWSWATVREAVKEVAGLVGVVVAVDGNAWAIEGPLSRMAALGPGPIAIGEVG